MQPKFIVPITAAGLLLSACSSDTAEPASIEAKDASATSSETTTKVAEDKAGQLNSPMEISKLDDNDVFMTVTELTIGEDCRNGVWAPEYRNDQLGDQFQYLQIMSEVDVQKLDNPQSGGMVVLATPKFVDKDGFTSDAEMAADCKNLDASNDSWYSETLPGDKSRRYGAFIVPTGVSEVRVEGKIFKVN